MADITLLKNKYLTIASKGLFESYNPHQLNETHKEVENFLAINADTIDATELFTLYELQFYLSILTNHDIEAKSYLDRILDQFNSAKSQRIKLLKSIYFEAIGDDKSAVKFLGSHPDELRLSRRLTTFSRKQGQSNESYIENLVYYLDLQPSDLVAWAELGEQYAKLGHYDKAIFSLKEILLQEPHAYNVFYKVGLYHYYSFLQNYNDKISKKDKILEWLDSIINARDNFLRSVEIGGDFIKGWIGIYLISSLDFNTKIKSLGGKQIDEYLKQSTKLLELSKRKIKELHGIEDEAELKSLLSVTSVEKK